MSAIRGTDTGPEILVRRYLHAVGLRFRLHDRRLPGRPDIVVPRYRAAVFVHGCFWHRHAGCAKATMPATRSDFWRAKFDGNVERDSSNERKIIEAGWRPLVVWECELASAESLENLFWRIVSED